MSFYRRLLRKPRRLFVCVLNYVLRSYAFNNVGNIESSVTRKVKTVARRNLVVGLVFVLRSDFQIYLMKSVHILIGGVLEHLDALRRPRSLDFNWKPNKWSSAGWILIDSILPNVVFCFVFCFQFEVFNIHMVTLSVLQRRLLIYEEHRSQNVSAC